MNHAAKSILNFLTRTIQIYFSEKRSIPTKIIMFPFIWVILNVGAVLYAFQPPEKQEPVQTEMEL